MTFYLIAKMHIMLGISDLVPPLNAVIEGGDRIGAVRVGKGNVRAPVFITHPIGTVSTAPYF